MDKKEKIELLMMHISNLEENVIDDIIKDFGIVEELERVLSLLKSDYLPEQKKGMEILMAKFPFKKGVEILKSAIGDFKGMLNKYFNIDTGYSVGFLYDPDYGGLYFIGKLSYPSLTIKFKSWDEVNAKTYPYQKTIDPCPPIIYIHNGPYR